MTEQPSDRAVVKSPEELLVAYNREVAAGRENLAEATTVGFQYHLATAQAQTADAQKQIAEAQERWARISTGIAVASVIVAIAAVLVAALR